MRDSHPADNDVDRPRVSEVPTPHRRDRPTGEGNLSDGLREATMLIGIPRWSGLEGVARASNRCLRCRRHHIQRGSISRDGWR